MTINYRLGMFGFMSTEDREAGGNYGMLDQVKHMKYAGYYFNWLNIAQTKTVFEVYFHSKFNI